VSFPEWHQILALEPMDALRRTPSTDSTSSPQACSGPARSTEREAFPWGPEGRRSGPRAARSRGILSPFLGARDDLGVRERRVGFETARTKVRPYGDQFRSHDATPIPFHRNARREQSHDVLCALCELLWRTAMGAASLRPYQGGYRSGADTRSGPTRPSDATFRPFPALVPPESAG
jgi:hypothetical protein